MAGLLMLIIGLLLGACQPTFASETAAKIPPCGDKLKMQKLLNEKFGEEPLLWGTIRGGAIITIYAGPKANWTMTKTVNDVLCIMAIGKDLKVVDHVGKNKTI